MKIAPFETLGLANNANKRKQQTIFRMSWRLLGTQNLRRWFLFLCSPFHGQQGSQQWSVKIAKKTPCFCHPHGTKLTFFSIQVGSHHLFMRKKAHDMTSKKISSTHHTTKISPRSLGEQRFRKEACKSIQGLFQSFYLHLKPRGLRWKKRFCSSLEINRYLYIEREREINSCIYIYISNNTHVFWKKYLYILYIYISIIIKIYIYTCVSSLNI